TRALHPRSSGFEPLRNVHSTHLDTLLSSGPPTSGKPRYVLMDKIVFQPVRAGRLWGAELDRDGRGFAWIEGPKRKESSRAVEELSPTRTKKRPVVSEMDGWPPPAR